MADAEQSDHRQTTSRRSILGSFATLSLSAGAVGLLAGCQSSRGSITSAAAAEPQQDIGILNFALGLEHEAIAAYQISADSGLLQPAVRDVAILFQGHHMGHRDALAGTVTQLGGLPVEPKTTAEYATRLNAASLASQDDILNLARELEMQAANAYLGAIPTFDDRALAQIAGRLAADETMHWTALAQATNTPLPVAPLTFGA